MTDPQRHPTTTDAGIAVPSDEHSNSKDGLMLVSNVAGHLLNGGSA
jgi:hypothetical protein